MVAGFGSASWAADVDAPKALNKDEIIDLYISSMPQLKSCESGFDIRKIVSEGFSQSELMAMIDYANRNTAKEGEVIYMNDQTPEQKAEFERQVRERKNKFYQEYEKSDLGQREQRLFASCQDQKQPIKTSN